MLNAGWMFHIFLFCWLPNVLGNDVYDPREWRNVWILETEGFDWTRRKSACRAGSVLESTLQLFLSSLPQREWKMLSRQASPHQLASRGLTAMQAECFYWPPCVILGCDTSMSMRKSFWCALAVSFLEGSASVAVVLLVLQKACRSDWKDDGAGVCVWERCCTPQRWFYCCFNVE